MFLRNAWYMAGWDRDVGREIQPRTILGEDLVLYRKQDGTPVALEDSCAHRRAPLSMGRLEGDTVECGYHGLVYDCTGACVHVPGQDAIPPDVRVRSYPVVEKWTGVWVWMGDPAKADEALVPDFRWNCDPGWTAMRGTMKMAASYRLMVENLLDLTHLGYLHRDSIGNPETAEHGRVETRRGPGTVVLERRTADCATPPYYRELRGLPARIDRSNTVAYLAPSCVVIESAAAPAGAGLMDGDKSRSKTHMVLNALTPVTEEALVYHWSNLRNYRLDDTAASQAYNDGLYRVFNEDRAMVEAQQRYFGAHPDARTSDFNIDSAVLEARRILAGLIDRETREAA